MKTTNGKKLIVAAFLSIGLLISSGAEAGGILALGGDSASAERQIGLFSQAIEWLNGTWSDLTSVFSFSDQTPPPPTTQECTSNCTDQGPGIDPLG